MTLKLPMVTENIGDPLQSDKPGLWHSSIGSPKESSSPFCPFSEGHWEVEVPEHVRGEKAQSPEIMDLRKYSFMR